MLGNVLVTNTLIYAESKLNGVGNEEKCLLSRHTTIGPQNAGKWKKVR